jgi:DNA-binding PadR family transcriptional regulator
MALGDAILVCLTDRPMTGYELAKTFDTSVGFFWRADHQQIYRELSKLKTRGLVTGEEVAQAGRPNKFVYALTPKGTAALRTWSQKPSASPSIKDDLLVRLYALADIDIGALRTDVMARLEYHKDRLTRYEAILAKRFPRGANSPAELGRLLGLRLGLRYERNWVEWCEEALAALSGGAAARAGNIVEIDHTRKGKGA